MASASCRPGASETRAFPSDGSPDTDSPLTRFTNVQKRVSARAKREATVPGFMDVFESFDGFNPEKAAEAARVL